MNIYINGRRLVKEPEVKAGLVDAFQSLLYDLNNWCPPFPNLLFNLISLKKCLQRRKSEQRSLGSTEIKPHV